MLRASLAIAALCVAGSAAAEPAPEALAPPTDQQCKVTIISAPERVRVEIEQWVAAEHRCSRTLQLRIEPGEGGLTVYARDDRGHVRERLVPDDQSIGALIVSWIADDAPAPSPPPPPPLPPERPAPRRPDPGGVPLLAPEAELAAVVPPAPGQTWWMLSGAVSISELHKFGVRAERDFLSRGPWRLDLALSQLENSRDSLAVSMTTATAFGAYERSRGGWQLRVQAGFGMRLFWIRNYCDCEQMGVDARATDYAFRPVSELTAMLGHSIGDQWALAFGGLVTIGTLGFDVPYQDRVSAMTFAGLRSRL